MIIAISGKIGVGKDTVGRIVQYLTCVNEKKGSHWSKEAYFGNHPVATEWLENHSDWKIKKFAYKLKQIVSILTGIPVGDLEKQEVKDMTFKELYEKGYISKSFYDSLDDC